MQSSEGMTNREREWIDAILAELAMANQLHPDWPSDPIHAAAIVAEESGELVRAALQHKYEDGMRVAMRTEAIQTAAMALRFLLEGSWLVEGGV